MSKTDVTEVADPASSRESDDGKLKSAPDHQKGADVSVEDRENQAGSEQMDPEKFKRD